MIYEEYESIWCKIRKQEKKLFKLIEKRDELFEKTQPKTTRTDKILVDSKTITNIQEQYVIQQEYLTEKINQLNTTLNDLYQVLKRKRDELKQSRHIDDRIYYYRYIERLSVFKIGMLVGYERTQVYRRLNRMSKKCNMQQNATVNTL